MNCNQQISFARELNLSIDLVYLLRLAENKKDINTLIGSDKVDLSRVRDRTDLGLIHILSSFYEDFFNDEYREISKRISSNLSLSSKEWDPLEKLYFPHVRNFRGDILKEKLPSLINDCIYVELRKNSSKFFVEIFSRSPLGSGLVSELISTPFEIRELRTDRGYQSAMINLYTKAYANTGFS